MHLGVFMRRHMYKIIAALVGLVVIIFAVVWFTPSFHQRTADMWSAISVPTELRSALFVSSSDKGSVVYRDSGSSYVSIQTFPHPFIAAARTGNALATTNFSKSSFTLNLPDRELYATTSMGALAVSPDGTRMAFVHLKDPRKRFDPNASSSETVLFYPIPQKAFVAGIGFAPLFTDNTHLLRFTEGGIFSMDLISSAQTALLREYFPFVSSTVHQSPDRTLLSFADPYSGLIKVYRVQPTTLTLVASLPFLKTYALGNAAAYEVRSSPGTSTTIWKYELKDGAVPHRILSLPAHLSITQLYL
jgi:hypothetical protein